MKSFAKINTFLKIVGTRGGYHEILSRFVLIDWLFDEIEFLDSDCFKIECDNTKISDNIVLKAMKVLSDAGYKNEIDCFFKTHKIVIKKNIPIGAGLGGGSSNAATFLKMVNDELNLNLSKSELLKIATKIGADVAFFLSDLRAANVSGIGEKILPFDDKIPEISILTPDIFCSTPAVYSEFRANFMQNIDVNLAQKMFNQTSKELLQNYKNFELNDLYAPCFKTYPKMQEFKDKFLSGSGSSVFFLKG